MKNSAQINIEDLIKIAGANLADMRAIFEKQKAVAESKGHKEFARVFGDMLICVDQLQIIHFALTMSQNTDNAALTKPGAFTPDLGNSMTGALIDSLIAQIQPGDTLQSFAARELADRVETAHNFILEEGEESVEFEDAISIVIDAGKNPHDELTPSIQEMALNAEITEKESRNKTTEDFNHDARAFIGAAMGYQHALNLISGSPDLLARLKGYAQP